MPRLFVRKSRGVGNWDGVDSQTAEDLNFPADVLSDVLDAGNEVSIWEVDPQSTDMDYLVAALHRKTEENLSDVTFRVISDWRIKQLNFKMKNATGGSLDPKLNGCHRVVEVSTVLEAIQLAKAFKERDPCLFSRAEVMRRFAASLQAKRISTDKVSHQLWKRLIDEGHMQIVTQQFGSPNVGTASPSGTS